MSSIVNSSIALTVQVFSIRDDQECPIAGNFSQNLLGEENHRVALAGALRVPEDAESALVSFYILGSRDRLVHAEELMVLRQQFVGFALGFEQCEVFD